MLILSVCKSSKLCNCINGLNKGVLDAIKKHATSGNMIKLQDINYLIR